MSHYATLESYIKKGGTTCEACCTV